MTQHGSTRRPVPRETVDPQVVASRAGIAARENPADMPGVDLVHGRWILSFQPIDPAALELWRGWTRSTRGRLRDPEQVRAQRACLGSDEKVVGSVSEVRKIG